MLYNHYSVYYILRRRSAATPPEQQAKYPGAVRLWTSGLPSPGEKKGVV